VKTLLFIDLGDGRGELLDAVSKKYLTWHLSRTKTLTTVPKGKLRRQQLRLQRSLQAAAEGKKEGKEAAVGGKSVRQSRGTVSLTGSSGKISPRWPWVVSVI
jgi:hypothetical protein